MDNKVFATIGEKEITMDDLQAVLASLPPQHAQQLSQQGIDAVVEEAINQELFYLEGKANEVDKTEAYKQELELIEKNLVRGFALNQILEKVEATDEELKKSYEEKKEFLVAPKKVKASHILVEDEAKAKELKAKLDTESFEELAKQNSICPSKERGGDLGFFQKGQMVPEFEQAAFSMKVDEISEPVKTQFGYHIIKVTDVEKESTQTFEQARAQLEQELLNQKRQQAYLDYVKSLREKYEVKKNG